MYINQYLSMIEVDYAISGLLVVPQGQCVMKGGMAGHLSFGSALPLCRALANIRLQV